MKTIEEIENSNKKHSGILAEITIDIREAKILALIAEHIKPLIPEGYTLEKVGLTNSTTEIYGTVLASKSIDNTTEKVKVETIHTHHCCHQCKTCKYGDTTCTVAHGNDTGVVCELCSTWSRPD